MIRVLMSRLLYWQCSEDLRSEGTVRTYLFDCSIFVCKEKMNADRM